MLPLWIIDITGKSDRRDAFQRLVGKIDHVHIPTSIIERSYSKISDKNDSSIDLTSPDHSGVESDIISYASNEETPIQDRTLSEKVAEESRIEAEKNARVEGDYWYYTLLDNPFEKELPKDFEDNLKNILQEKVNGNNDSPDDSVSEEDRNTYEHAMKLYMFQEEMVKEGVKFINTLRHSNAKPYQSVNVVVLGDATEELTTNVFSSIAAIILKEKGRILPSHIHQGISIFGCLYIPCDLNTQKVDIRNRVLHLLKEIEVQRNISSIRGYDHMMLYQNVQNRTECYYPMLDAEHQAEYLVQCLVHLFLACDINHPLISGTSSEDTFYFSMGAASVHFDMQVEDAKETNKVARDLVSKFKEDGTGENNESFKPLLDNKVYNADEFVKLWSKIESIDISDVDTNTFIPHPVNNYFSKNLKRMYYMFRLKYFPADLLRKILTIVEQNTSDLLDIISSESLKAYKYAEMAIHPAIVRRLADVTESDGALAYVENLIRDMQEAMSKEKDRIRICLEEHFWLVLMKDDNLTIPNNLKDYFEEYHEIYKMDVSSKNDGAGCTSAKEDALKKLKDLLSQEKTTLSTLLRTFFLGIICVLSIVPLLDLISPSIIDLGNVKKYSFFWGVGVFMIPFAIQLCSLWLYLRKRDARIRVLKAYYLHDAYARLANRVESEANEFYQKMTDLGEEYLKRCKQIRNEVHVGKYEEDEQMVFPTTMFNQPLNGGTFNHEEIIPAKEVECRKIRIANTSVPVNELSSSNYYILINTLNDTIGKLFSGVSVINCHSRRFDPKNGDYVFVSKETLQQEMKENWDKLRKEFVSNISCEINNQMLPREYPTAGDKLYQYKRKIDNYTLLEPLMSFAATNGEITSHADTEYADIKVNREIHELSDPYLPLVTTRTQVIPFESIFRKYIFITRWRCFDHFSFNRILPREDFDRSRRLEVNYKESVEEEKMNNKKKENLSKGKSAKEPEPVVKEIEPYKQCPSSLIMWAVCPNDNSGEWLKIIPAEHFGRAFLDREKYREVLNQND